MIEVLANPIGAGNVFDLPAVQIATEGESQDTDDFSVRFKSW
jgi:hypothetical protein